MTVPVVAPHRCLCWVSYETSRVPISVGEILQTVQIDIRKRRADDVPCWPMLLAHAAVVANEGRLLDSAYGFCRHRLNNIGIAGMLRIPIIQGCKDRKS